MSYWWYAEQGPESDIIISTRVRLARNFNKYPFPSKMTKEQAAKVAAESRSAILESNSPIAREFTYVDLGKLDPIEKQSLVEAHLMSPEMVSRQENSGLILSRDNRISIMVNEEDHLRIQCLFPGLQLDKALDLCSRIDSLLEERVEYAYSQQLGYLTCCPSNLGTGMRASVMIHLPALAMTGYLPGMLEAVTKIGIAVRGLYGENSQSSGNLFQISNQVTLGQTEKEIVSNLYNVVGQIMERERSIRSELYKQNRVMFEDKIWRSYGVFVNARVMSSEEFMSLFSDIRLGYYMGILPDIPIEKMQELMVLTQPANLQKRIGRSLTAEERDEARASLVREYLAK